MIKNDIVATQQQFDALYLLIYLTGNIVDPIGNLIKSKGIDNITREEAKNEMITYLRGRGESSWAKYGAGWTNRVLDILEVWFDGEYDRDH